MTHGHLDPASREPIDPDVDLRHPAPAEVRASELPVVTAIAIGGAIGASARYLVELAWPTSSGSLPWATFMINMVGCALIGVLMVLVSEVWMTHRLVRPFLGTGILGGFTTFSTYAVDIQGLLNDGHPVTALLYLAITVIGALAVVWATTTTTRALVHRRSG
ncbi:fluoride efflux transporter CrcB [Kribbella sp. VKM Ac-2568]|uniref:fluoride efflux transporter CrcB n=1 Tax=Kribbella sp. VKM Ac-2568 TaxID=2512219 RepID=UPI0010476D08|nr:fluoride efflux transporter CrcB [Kribbella sp. VKM Ac-2568]TCM51641.1 CrcB protein [Kribbella sp. VKM Ac-2568]